MMDNQDIVIEDTTDAHYLYLLVSADPVSEPVREVCLLPGWLSPSGEYYPCEPVRHFKHHEKAIHLIAYYYPGTLSIESEIDLSAIPYSQPRECLLDQGWVCIDTAEIDFWKKPTAKQVDTLFDLWRLAQQMRPRGWPMTYLRRVLAWCDLGFMSRPGDDYEDFEIKIGKEPGLKDVQLIVPTGRFLRG